MRLPGVLVFGLVLLVSISAAQAAACVDLDGPYVVVEVPAADPLGGLAVRDAADPRARRLGIIPADAEGIRIGRCEASGWCRVLWGCLQGWSNSAKFLALRDKRLVRVVGVEADDPDGLNFRRGPGALNDRIGSFPHDAEGLVRHACEASASDGAPWCLVGNGRVSGWVARRFLEDQTAERRPDPEAPPPPPLQPRLSPSRGCLFFPDLC